MSRGRVLSRIVVVVLLLALITLAAFVVAALLRKPPVVNIEVDLSQPASALTAEVIRQGLDAGGFRGVTYDTADYDLIGEKVQDTSDARDISVGVTSRPLDPAVLPDVVSLGTVSEQPLLFVTRGDAAALTSPAQLVGKRIQVGLPGSVENEVGVEVLAQFDVTDANSEFLFDKHEIAKKSLLSGDVDAMVVLYGYAESDMHEQFARHALHVIPTPSAKAVAGRVGYVVAGVLPQGAFSAARTVPPIDIPVIEVPITVIGRSGLSRAAVFDIAEALRNQFGRGTVLAPPGAFPTFTNTIPSDPAAVQFYTDGIVPWQYRSLPAPIADLFIPLAVIGSILIVVLSVYQVLLPDALQLWMGVLRPRRHRKRAGKKASSEGQR